MCEVKQKDSGHRMGRYGRKVLCILLLAAFLCFSIIGLLQVLLLREEVGKSSKTSRSVVDSLVMNGKRDILNVETSPGTPQPLKKG